MSRDPMFLPEYQRAVDGTMPGADHDAFEEASELLLNLDELVEGALARIFEYAMGARFIESAFDFVKKEAKLSDRARLDDDPYYHVFLVLDIALKESKTDTRYWGVEDPALSSYCGYCKKALPIEEFNHTRHTCDECYKKRRRI